MAQKTLELTLISAKDLKDVNIFSKMEVYAVVSINGDARTRQRTPPDRDGGSSPAWNATLRLPLPPAASGALHVLLRAERALGDRDVGEVHIPLRELLDSNKARPGQPQFVSYQVRKPGSGKPKGVLNISYRLLDAAAAPSAAPPVSYPAPAASTSATAYPPPGKAPEPVTAYPPSGKTSEPVTSYPPPWKGPEPVTSYPPPGKGPEPVTAYPAAYPPPGAYPQPGPAAAAPYSAPAGYPSYPPPPQYGPPAGYGYPPPAGYGYGGYGAAPPVQPPKKNKFGMGLGAGLLGGALGGLLIGDMISDAGDYDSGYDAGFDDGGGGFDF